MKTLLVLPVPAYAFLVVALATARRGNRNSTRRVSATSCRRFFCACKPSMADVREATERLTGVLVGQISTLMYVRRSRCGKRNGGFQPTRKPL